MKLRELIATQERLAAMREAIRNGVPFPDTTALPSICPATRRLMIHFNRDDEMTCRLLNDDEIEFIGDIYNRVLDNPFFRPSREDLTTIQALNLKMSMCGGTA